MFFIKRSELMKIIIYSTHQFEKPYLKKAADSSQLNCQLTFILESLNEHTVELARGSDAVSIFTSDIANAQVLKSLHKMTPLISRQITPSKKKK